MGMFDELLLPCPKCGKQVYTQSKGGVCKLKKYIYPKAPDDVISYIVNDKQECKCGCVFKVKAKFELVEWDGESNDYDQD